MKERLDRHEKVALAYSGGKDSLACIYLLRDDLHRITVYHIDTGDELPEVRAAVAEVEAWVPHFVRVVTDVAGWIAANGIPSDLVPHSAHALGQVMGEGKVRLAARWDCCRANRAGALFERILADGNTMMISGVRRDDMRVLPNHDGDILPEGIEAYYPLEGWSAADVFAYLDSVGATLPPFYPELEHGMDCAGCSAWWSERRGAYLRRAHPEVFRQYQERLAMIIGEVTPVLHLLVSEVGRI